MADQMIRAARTPQEIADMQEYARLSQIEKTKGRLSKSETTRLNRVRLRCLKAKLIQPVSRERLEALARQAYNDMPWWAKLGMRLKFYTRRWKARWDLFKVSRGWGDG